MTVRFLTFEMYHGKSGTGSTRLRVHQLLNHWPEAALYQYGENPDALVLQKVYMQVDWRLIEHFKGIKVLDICDPDWLDGVQVKETIDAVDGVTCPTEPLAEFLRQLTDKPVQVIPDRHELSQFPHQRRHTGPIKSVVWFGYKHNAVALRWAVNFLVRNKLKLTCIANEDPQPYQWADDPDTAKSLYKFIRFEHETLNDELVQHDAALLPVGNRPGDRFKSNNKRVIAQLSGLPIIVDDATFEHYNDPDKRNDLDFNRNDWDIRKSVDEMKSFLNKLKRL